MSITLIGVEDVGVIIRNYLNSPTPEQRAEIEAAVELSLESSFDRGAGPGLTQTKLAFIGKLDALGDEFGNFPEKLRILAELHTLFLEVALEVMKRRRLTSRR